MHFVHLYSGVSASSSEGRQSNSLQLQTMQTAMSMSYICNVLSIAGVPTLIFEPTPVIAIVGAVKRFTLHNGSRGRERGSGPAKCVERLGARRCSSTTQQQLGTDTPSRLCYQMFVEFKCFVHTDAERSIVLQTVQGHPQRTKGLARCTASSFLFVDPVDFPSRSLTY